MIISDEEKEAVLEAIEGWTDLLNDAHIKDEDDIRLVDVLIEVSYKIRDNNVVFVTPQRVDEMNDMVKPEVDLMVANPDFLEIV